MKKALLFYLLMFLLIITGNAQNYQTYFSGKTISFSNPYEGLKFQRVDSVSISQGDSVLWFFPSFDMEDYHCVNPHGPNWSGRKLIVRENGDNVFFNKHNDSILLKTHAELHSPWLAYKKAGSFNIFAEVVNHDTLTFLGVTDSVKTIGFQVYDDNNNNISHALNNRHLKISKNYGLIKTFLFRKFPDYNPGYPYLIEYDITGISSPELGIRNLTWKEVFDDFYPGDELHVLYESCYGDLSDLSCSVRRSIFKYLTRIEYPDSLKYTVERISSLKTTQSGSSTGYVFTHDTITSLLRFHSDINFNKLSEESIIQGDVISFNLQSIKHIGGDKYVMTKTTDLYKDLEKVSEECWEFPVSDILIINPDYMKGLGGPYYWASMWDSFSRRRPVYYKKGSEEWGSPMTIVDETGTDNPDEPGITVFPNPAGNYVWLTADIPVFFEIIDLHGSVLITELIDSGHQQIDTSKLKEGIYIYRIRKAEMVYKTGKLLIRK